jgi:hypothetical protein
MAFYLTRKPNFCLTKSVSAKASQILLISVLNVAPSLRALPKIPSASRISERSDAWQLPKDWNASRSHFYRWKDFFAKAFAEWLQPVIELH